MSNRKKKQSVYRFAIQDCHGDYVSDTEFFMTATSLDEAILFKRIDVAESLLPIADKAWNNDEKHKVVKVEIRYKLCEE